MTAFGLSLILFLAGLFTAERGSRNRIQATASSSLVFLFVILSSAFLLSNYFTGEGINDAVIYHLLYGLEGAGFGEYYPLIASAAALLSGGFLLSFVHYRRLNRVYDSRGKRFSFILSNAFILGGILLNPATNALLYLTYSNSDHFKPLKYYRPSDIQNSDYVQPDLLFNNSERSKDHGKSPRYNQPLAEKSAKESQSDIDATSTRVSEDHLEFLDHYRPSVVRKAYGPQPNLVFIYAESLERTYFDENIFPGLIRELRSLESESTFFTDIHQTAGSGWTVGGMISGQCGLPLVTPSQGNSMSGMDSFYSGAICLGDLLHGEGYNLFYLNGASLDFAGKGKLYTTHRFDEVKGLDELLPLLEDRSYVSAWGLFDDSLLDLSFEKFTQLSESKTNFGLFMLTLDTHHPDGHPSKSCEGIQYSDGSNAMLNAIACSDYLISDFVNRVRKSSHGDNTVIVITSDHLAMTNTATYLLEKGDRKNLFMIFDPRVKQSREIGKRGTVLDIGPTILHALGFDGDIGLGRDLLSNETPLADKFEKLNDKIHSWKPSIKKFWEFPTIDGGILVDAGDRTIQIGVTKYKMPVLIELGENLEATPYFEFRSPKKLNEFLLEFGEDTPFLWFDKCYKARALENDLKGGPFCFVGGKLGGTLASTHLDRNISLSVDVLDRVMNNRTDPELFALRNRNLLGFFAGEDAPHLVENSTEKSFVYVPESRTDLHAIEYYNLHNRVGVNRVPIDQEFYFLSSQLTQNQYVPFFDFQPADGEAGRVIRATPKVRPPRTPNHFQVRRVAHGGGAVNGKHYTNSIDALNLNVKNGYQYFEIDFSFTKDDRLVCIHDWEGSFKRSFGFENAEIPTLDNFISLVREHSEFEKCTLDSLADWMRQNPTVKLITDVKNRDNIKALTQIMESFPDARERVIPQVYNPKNMKPIKDMGFSSAIWTLYRYGGDTDMVLRWVDLFDGSFAITMPKERADSILPLELKKRGIPTYVHTINDPEEMQRYFSAGISEIYTDRLAPDGTVYRAMDQRE